MIPLATLQLLLMKKEMNNIMKKHSKYAILGFRALQRAAEKVAEDARRNNYKIPVWKNGQIEFEIPVAITEQKITPDKKKPGKLS